MGRCAKCGFLCPRCGGDRSDFSLKTLPESVRQLVWEVLTDVDASQAEQDRLVRAIESIAPEHIQRAYRIWKAQNCASRGVGYGYFKAICLRCMSDSSKDKTLDDLPPLIT
jgi:phenylpropionate dioxygenase-like ring-hydroxylating dioxygenase large terminal subunit